MAHGQPNIFLRILKMQWLWSTFAGFYLVAYVFWVPSLFGNVVEVILVAGVTLLLGFGLLFDGFGAALALQQGSTVKPSKYQRPRRLVSGLVLLAYLAVYLPPKGRIVAHWPLDLAITAASGVVIVAYAALGD